MILLALVHFQSASISYPFIQYITIIVYKGYILRQWYLIKVNSRVHALVTFSKGETL
jgi:hypothetical protein